MERKEILSERIGGKFKVGSVNLISVPHMCGGLRLAVQLADELIQNNNSSGNIHVLDTGNSDVDIKDILRMLPNAYTNESKKTIHLKTLPRNNSIISDAIDNVMESFNCLDTLNVYILTRLTTDEFECSCFSSKVMNAIQHIKRSNIIVFIINQCVKINTSYNMRYTNCIYNDFQIDKVISGVSKMYYISTLDDKHHNRKPLDLIIDNAGVFRMKEKLKLSTVYGEMLNNYSIITKPINHEFRKYTCLITDELNSIINTDNTIFLKDHHLCDHRAFCNYNKNNWFICWQYSYR